MLLFLAGVVTGAVTAIAGLLLAGRVSATWGQDLTVSWRDYAPALYHGTPEHADHADFWEDELAHEGWCLIANDPFPGSEEGVTEENAYDPPAWNEPVALSYCELRVTATEVSWWYWPKHGSCEENTTTLSRETLEAIAAQLKTMAY